MKLSLLFCVKAALVTNFSAFIPKNFKTLYSKVLYDRMNLRWFGTDKNFYFSFAYLLLL